MFERNRQRQTPKHPLYLPAEIRIRTLKNISVPEDSCELLSFDMSIDRIRAPFQSQYRCISTFYILIFFFTKYSRPFSQRQILEEEIDVGKKIKNYDGYASRCLSMALDQKLSNVKKFENYTDECAFFHSSTVFLQNIYRSFSNTYPQQQKLICKSKVLHRQPMK